MQMIGVLLIKVKPDEPTPKHAPESRKSRMEMP
jgi:hypothetical protein